MAAKEKLQAKVEEVRRLAVASRKKLVEITVGIELLRQEVKELSAQLGGAPPPASPDEAEREFEEIRTTEILHRHDA
ncbi:MAG TPA: hypothetical protein VKN99_21570 [Polyangia bacterium]|nr:hypothetical protein [Polyangia bacterium]